MAVKLAMVVVLPPGRQEVQPHSLLQSLEVGTAQDQVETVNHLLEASGCFS